MNARAIETDLTQAVETETMRPIQIGVVTVCLLINLCDGFDVLLIAFTAASIAEEWQLDSGQLGIVFSAALFGMTLGALFLSSLADYIGRRRMTLVSLTCIGVAMIMTAQVSTVTELMWLRFATGLGIGAILPGINSMVAEYSPRRLRNFSLAMMHVAYPGGALLSGFVVILLLEPYGWRSIFMIGGVVSLLLVPVVWIWVPESLQYLNYRRPANVLRRVNEILPKLGHGVLSRMPPLVARSEAPGVMGLFSSKFRTWTLLYWIAFFAAFLSLYLVLSWTPKLVVEHGHSNHDGVYVGMLMNAGALIGTPSLGWISLRLGLRRVLIGYSIAASALIVALALSLGSLPWLYMIAFPLGLFLVGIPPGIYAIGARMYPAALRSTGVGVAIGVGRLGAIAGPTLAGGALLFGWSPLIFMTLLGTMPLLVVAAAVSGIRASELGPVLTEKT